MASRENTPPAYRSNPVPADEIVLQTDNHQSDRNDWRAADAAPSSQAQDGSEARAAGSQQGAMALRTEQARFLTDARLEIDNNIAENAIRGIALGRKNYLFAGSNAGGERAATMYTIMQTAKLNDVNPEAYLRDILGRIADGHPINRISELLPWQPSPSP
jgi:IS66 C-terminal element/Transposase IS66 family